MLNHQYHHQHRYQIATVRGAPPGPDPQQLDLFSGTTQSTEGLRWTAREGQEQLSGWAPTLNRHRAAGHVCGALLRYGLPPGVGRQKWEVRMFEPGDLREPVLTCYAMLALEDLGLVATTLSGARYTRGHIPVLDLPTAV